MNKKENHQQWAKKVEQFKKSGKTKEEWCKKKNISIKQFTYWLRQFPEEFKETQWLPVEIKQEKMPASLNIKIGSTSIEIYPGFNKELLLTVLATLTAL